MDAIYRCSTRNGIIEIDADTFDSVGIIKNLAKIVHNSDVIEILDEIQVSHRRENRPITRRLPDELRDFIGKKMHGQRHLVSHLSSYVMRNKIKPHRYQFILATMIRREKEEEDERNEQKALAQAIRDQTEKLGEGTTIGEVGEVCDLAS